jgi:hypothetical protein
MASPAPRRVRLKELLVEVLVRSRQSITPTVRLRPSSVRVGGPGGTRTIDQPIMRPALDRLRMCQGVSGVLNKLDRGVVFVSQSVLECHGADVRTVVRTDAPRFASAGPNSGGTISQEFTCCVTAVSWRVRASQAVSRTTSRRRFDGLPASKPGDTVQRMVHGSREVQGVASRGRRKPGVGSAGSGLARNA